jgi:fumarylpyruvate hydrolase
MTHQSEKFVFAPPAPIGVPIIGGGQFPVRRIFCVGRNYAAHTREMGGNPDREPPFFFTKPSDAIILGDHVPYPVATHSLHHEVELVIALDKAAHAISPAHANSLIYGYAVGVDLTRRDLQDEAKSMRRPWDMAKGFDHSAPIGPIIQAAQIGHPTKGAITLAINNQVKQSGDLADLIWPVPDIIAALSHLVALAPGDLIYTGTPDGVGPLVVGDHVTCHIDGIPPLAFTITPPAPAR